MEKKKTFLIFNLKYCKSQFKPETSRVQQTQRKVAGIEALKHKKK